MFGMRNKIQGEFGGSSSPCGACTRKRGSRETSTLRGRGEKCRRNDRERLDEGLDPILLRQNILQAKWRATQNTSYSTLIARAVVKPIAPGLSRQTRVQNRSLGTSQVQSTVLYKLYRHKQGICVHLLLLKRALWQ